jgi:SAM-dependent methyltransferase
MNVLSSPLPTLDASQHRLTCVTCNYQINPQNPPEFAVFDCNLRAHAGKKFRIWRCPTCSSIHCLEKVNLNEYYENYPLATAELTFPLRLCYRNTLKRLVKHGFTPDKSLLDYGCANGIVLQYLQERGYSKCYGYDPYGTPDRFGNIANLSQAPFDYILLQDVLEHDEDPYALLGKLNSLLAPGGCILIGVPRADTIDLTQTDRCDFYNAVHAPCHLHIYTKDGLESLGKQQGWQPVAFYDHAFHDTRWFGLNARTWNAYQRLGDGAIDSIFEPIHLGKAITSPSVVFNALFGYWLSYKTDMAMMFRK